MNVHPDYASERIVFEDPEKHAKSPSRAPIDEIGEVSEVDESNISEGAVFDRRPSQVPEILPEYGNEDEEESSASAVDRDEDAKPEPEAEAEGKKEIEPEPEMAVQEIQKNNSPAEPVPLPPAEKEAVVEKKEEKEETRKEEKPGEKSQSTPMIRTGVLSANKRSRVPLYQRQTVSTKASRDWVKGQTIAAAEQILKLYKSQPSVAQTKLRSTDMRTKVAEGLILMLEKLRTTDSRRTLDEPLLIRIAEIAKNCLTGHRQGKLLNLVLEEYKKTQEAKIAQLMEGFGNCPVRQKYMDEFQVFQRLLDGLSKRVGADGDKIE